MSRAPRQSLAQIFAVPALIALASAMGLAGALVGEGVWDTRFVAVPRRPCSHLLRLRDVEEDRQVMHRHSGAARQG